MSTIELQTLDSGIFNLILNRPEKGNAFDDVMIAELISTLNQLANNDDVRILILSANGKHFCTGADLSWMQRMVDFSREENIKDAKNLGKLFQTLYKFPKPTIACVHGATYGGGLGLIACCDIALAADELDTVFCFSEVKLGLVPATIAPYIVNAIGPRQAKRYFLTAEKFNTDRAIEIGLIHEKWEQHKNSFQQPLEIANKILKNGSNAMGMTKKLVSNLCPITPDVQQMTAEVIATSRTSEEAQTRLRAFLEKTLSKAS